MVEHIPYISNKSPYADEYDVSSSTLISFDVLDNYGDLQQENLKAYIDDVLAFEGYADNFSFNNPFDASGSDFYGVFYEVSRQKLIAPDAASSDQFGFSVAINGDVCVIGSPYDDDGYSGAGSAYVFRLIDSVWTFEQKLTASDAGGSDYFGAAVAVYGNTIAIGAYNYDIPSAGVGDNVGAVYIFKYESYVWSESQILIPSIPDEVWGNENFGWSVSLYGTDLIVGAPHLYNQAGRATVFTETGGTWSEQDVLTPSDGVYGDLFGYTVAIHGDTCIIGSPYNDEYGSDFGAAYIFTRTGSSWSQQARLNQTGGSGSAQKFGFSVDIFGENCIIGAPGDDESYLNCGAAYIFSGSGDSWTQISKLPYSGFYTSSALGSSVAIDNTVAIASSPGVSVDGYYKNGEIVVYKKISGSWAEYETLYPRQDSVKSIGKERNIAISGMSIIGGASYDSYILSNAGSAFIFNGCDGYHITIDSYNSYSNIIEVCVDAYDSYGNSLLDECWSFNILLTNSPQIENRSPYSGETDVSQSVLISFDIIDQDGDLQQNGLKAYIDDVLVFDGYTSSYSFYYPYNDSGSQFYSTTVDGYDGYHIIIDSYNLYTYSSTIDVRALAEDSYSNTLDTTWSFTIETTSSEPYIINKFPMHNEPNASATTLIYFDILDQDGDLKQDGLTIWINGDRAFDGYADSYLFNSPYNASNSQFYSTTIDGYDGYHIIIDSYNSYNGVVTVRTTAEDVALNSFDGYWGFVVQRKINSVYFSDGYGLKKVDIQELVGEAQSSSKPLSGNDEKIPNFTRAKSVISTSSSPYIPSNEISSIFGNLVDGYFCLALSYSPDQIGTTVLINETETERYATYKSVAKAQLTDNGILYLINENDNQIDVYYGANFRDGYRTPDFIYNTSSTPNIVSGTITDLHIASGYSSKYRNGNRIYVGTTQGVTRIEAYDKDTNGYSDGYDSRGISIHYGISGSGLQYEVIGGSVSNIVSVDSDDENGIMFVGTSDGYNGGITQISITSNRKIIFMTYSDGSLPSNNIKDIFGKAL